MNSPYTRGSLPDAFAPEVDHEAYRGIVHRNACSKPRLNVSETKGSYSTLESEHKFARAAL